jgi:tetratricopeptide (TPR) repeat protein
VGQIIQTSNEAKKALGSYFKNLCKLDPLQSERKKTAAFKNKLISKFDSKCAYCNAKGSIDAAHIIPLEIGAKTTENNLILLCKHCHKTYDDGHLSISEMQTFARAFKVGEISSPGKKIALLNKPQGSITEAPASISSLSDDLLDMQRSNKHKKAVILIKKELGRRDLSNEEKIYLTIKLGELTRRRAARGVLDESLRYLESIDDSTVSKKYKPLYYYELGYVNRLVGNHERALDIYLKAREATSTSSGADNVATAVNFILCEMAGSDVLTSKQEQMWTEQLNKLAVQSQMTGGYWGGRWELNCRAHNLQVSIKARNEKTSREEFKTYQKSYFDSNVSKGWDVGSRQSYSLLKGLMFVLFPRTDENFETGIGLLARSFLARLGNRQRLEGIRDAGMGLAFGLKRKGGQRNVKIAKVLNDLMTRTVDGTSYIWPWRGEAASGKNPFYKTAL